MPQDPDSLIPDQTKFKNAPTPPLTVEEAINRVSPEGKAAWLEYDGSIPRLIGSVDEAVDMRIVQAFFAGRSSVRSTRCACPVCQYKPEALNYEVPIPGYVPAVITYWTKYLRDQDGAIVAASADWIRLYPKEVDNDQLPNDYQEMVLLSIQVPIGRSKIPGITVSTVRNVLDTQGIEDAVNHTVAHYRENPDDVILYDGGFDPDAARYLKLSDSEDTGVLAHVLPSTTAPKGPRIMRSYIHIPIPRTLALDPEFNAGRECTPEILEAIGHNVELWRVVRRLKWGI